MDWLSKIPTFLFSPVGRLRRQWFILTWLGCIATIVVLLVFLQPIISTKSYGKTVMLIAFLPLIPKCVISGRRLHDIGFSGWFAMIGVAPMAVICAGAADFFATNMQLRDALGQAIFYLLLADLVLCCVPGNRGANHYGPDPRQPDIATDQT